MSTVSGKTPTAVVSGGSSGIGRAFVQELCRRGYRVVTCGRDEAKLRRLEAEIPSVTTMTSIHRVRVDLGKSPMIFGESRSMFPVAGEA